MNKIKALTMLIVFLLLPFVIFAYDINVTINPGCTSVSYQDADGSDLSTYSNWNQYSSDPTSHPSYDHTVSSSCEIHVTVTIDDSVPPEELQSYIDTVTEGSELEGQVVVAEGVPAQQEESSQEAADTQTLDGLVEAANNGELNQIGNNNVKENESNSTTCGDPVLMATGDFTTTVQDIKFEVVSKMLSLSRTYLSSNSSAHSFGPGWTHNFDTRIIPGVKIDAALIARQAEIEAAEAASIYSTTIANFKNSLSALNQMIGSTINEESFINDLSGSGSDMSALYSELGLTTSNISGSVVESQNELQTTVNKLIIALNGDAASTYTKVYDVIENQLGNAENALSIVEAFVSRAIEAKHDLYQSWATVMEIKATKEALEENALQMGREEQMANENEARSRFVYNESDPVSQQMTGNLTLTLVDESGTPHLYSIDTPPDYLSTYYFDDGTINYYPNGASTTASLPNDDQLYIEGDGSYIVTSKQKDEKHYNYFGQLEKIVDINGNIISFSYDESHELVKITDPFNREINLVRENNRIVSATDPMGRVYSYAYDSSGRLISATNPKNLTIGYNYNNDVLSEIVKPDGSSRKYHYEYLQGKMKVTSTEDEEGNIEYFRYFPELGYTEYENADGEVEKHYYNDRNLETKVEYANGSYVINYYNPVTNTLYGKVDSLGRIWLYQYDENRNMTMRRDPLQNQENWTYNEFNKVTSYTDKQNRTTSYNYDSLGNLLSVSNPDGGTLSYSYNSQGLLNQTIDLLGATTWYFYDEYGHLTHHFGTAGPLIQYEYDTLGNLLKYTDNNGNSTIYTYDELNKLINVTDPLGFSEVYEYNNRGDMVKKTDKRGKEYIYDYDKRHKLVKETNPLGEITEYTYRGDGKITSRKIEAKSQIEYVYDSMGRLWQEKQINTGAIITYNYDSVGRLISKTDAEGNTTSFSYDRMDNVTLTTYADGSSESFGYYPAGELMYKTDKAGNTWQFYHDAMDRLSTVIDPLGNFKYFTYNYNGNLLSETDENNNTTSYTYNQMGLVASKINPANEMMTFVYDLRGLLASQENYNDGINLYEYDAVGQLIKETNPLGAVVEYNYDGAGNLTGRKDPKGEWSYFEYDDLNRKIKRTNPYGAQWSYGYDYLNNQTTVTDPLGNTVTKVYDDAGRLLSLTDATGNTTNYNYDLNNNLVSVIDPLDRITSYEYDELGRIVSKTDNLNQVTSYSYDQAGNLIRFQDPEGTDGDYGTEYEYDALNRMVKEINALGDEKIFQYDAAGNLEYKRDFNDADFSYDYDSLNRMIQKVDSDNNTSEYQYDSMGNMISASDENGEIQCSYDLAGQLVLYHDGAMDEDVAYTYDVAGNRTKVTWLNDLIEINYQYGKIGELLSVTDSEGETTSFEYDSLGREIKRTLPNGLSRTQSFDAASRVKYIQNKYNNNPSASADLRSWAYLYNEAGEKTFEVDSLGRITQHKYDAAGRVIESLYALPTEKEDADKTELESFGLTPGSGVISPAKSFDLTINEISSLNALYSIIATNSVNLPFYDPIWNEEFSYDKSGNRISKKTAWGEISFTYDALNRLVTAGNKDYTYDDNGNLIQEDLNGKSAVYQYSPENQLVDFYSEIPGISDLTQWNGKKGTHYEYDVMGRKTTRVEYNKDASGSIEWLYDTNQAYLYDGLGFQVLGEFFDADYQEKITGFSNGASVPYKDATTVAKRGSVLAGNDVLKRSFYDDIRWTNGSLITTEKYYNVQDSLGSTRLETTPWQTTSMDYSYDAFGTAYEGEFFNYSSIGFNGKRYDIKTGLYDYGFRHYSLAQARWISSDPIKDGSNWYAYCGNDPVNFVDLLGLEKILTVHVDQPGSGGDRDTFEWAGGDNFVTGHSFVSLEDTDTGEKETIGFYPTIDGDNSRKDVAFGSTYPGQFVDDSNYDSDKVDVEVSFVITDEGYVNANQKIGELKENVPDYDLETYNCVDYSIEIADSAGVELPKTEGDWLVGSGRNPGDFGEDLDAIEKAFDSPIGPYPDYTLADDCNE